MKHKIILPAIILLLLSLNSYSQQKHEFALTFEKSAGTAAYSILRYGFLVGHGSTVLQNNNEFGLRYFRPVNDKGRAKMEIGLTYTWGKLKVKPAFTGDPESDTPWYKDFNLVSLPIYMNHGLGKYLFFNYGLMLDYQNAKEVQYTGFGFGIGLGYGARYTAGKYTLFINPNYQKHLFLSEKDGLMEMGLLFGISYTL